MTLGEWVLVGVGAIFLLLAPWSHALNWAKFNNRSRICEAVIGIEALTLLVSWVAVYPVCLQIANPYLTREENHQGFWILGGIAVWNIYAFGVGKYGDMIRLRRLKEWSS